MLFDTVNLINKILISEFITLYNLFSGRFHLQGKIQLNNYESRLTLTSAVCTVLLDFVSLMRKSSANTEKWGEMGASV